MIFKQIKRKLKSLFIRIGAIKPPEMPQDIFNPKLIGTKQCGNLELIKIGENVSFGGEVLLYANAEIEIGDYTMVAHHVIFHTSTHDYNDHPMWEKRIDRPIKVGKHVWIGTGVIILPGIIIGDYSVIAAGSVVNANVPEGAIVGGNPAYIIKYRDKQVYEKEQVIFDREDATITPQSYISKSCKERQIK